MRLVVRVMAERAATELEQRVAEHWMAFALDCLTDDQLTHCGHLDGGWIVDGCEFCQEVVDRAVGA